jgi:hypothetical protein
VSRSKLIDGAGTQAAPWVPESDAEREAIREQLGRILASALFRNSKRFPNLLSYTVECALKGNGEPLKERALGIEVFGRQPDYDTTQDPVVRMTAVEIRKRLAQYYQTPGRETEIRIDFPPGSYVPEFHPPAQMPIQVQEAAAVETAPPATRKAAPVYVGLILALLCAAAIVVALVWWSGYGRENALDRFWNPVLSSRSTVLLCVPNPPTIPQPDPNAPIDIARVPVPTTVGELLDQDAIRFSDALVLSKLTAFLQSRGAQYRIRRTGATAFEDLRDGPVVLIGGFNNAWTLRLGDQLRFTFAREENRSYIRDRQNPSNREWGNGRESTPLANVPENYGIISRVLDPATGRFVVTVAGLLYGTRAAGECLTDPACMADAGKLAPGDWKHKNIQIVISTKLIAHDSGPPRVLATYLW